MIGPHHSIIARLTSAGQGAAAWMMWRSDDMSYFLRTSSGSFISRMNMVGTMKMVSIFSVSTTRKNSSGSKRGMSTSAPPRRPARRPNEFGAE